MTLPASYDTYTYDIFCAVIDNYGDIGVSWRLAHQLANEYGITVRLWVDDLAALRHICPGVRTASSQRIAGVEVYWWQSPFAEVEAAAVVIEAFACVLPASYIQTMTQRSPPSLWINLEYLSAEGWVADCHGLPSPQPLSSSQQHPALNKYFFFPGFTDRTGGLLRERELLAARRAFQADANARVEFLTRFGLQDAAAGLTVSLFAYENAGLPALLSAWVSSTQPIVCLVPEGRSIAAIAHFFGEINLAAGALCRRGALTVAVLPFLAQDDYDRLLWSCDLNLVRGEDSFVRAQWAGRPLIWHIYPQQEGAHWRKLDAFLQLYRASLPASTAASLTNCWRAWNGDGDIAAAWRDLEPVLAVLSEHARQWSDELERRGNLAATLVQFCANHV